ncbi:hypothetical protein BD779DRAFT_1487101 [Infundibulicybe gibba]|nr:hypothetical protein BD779DRAFT_1487101 [Infundibulicybe gibba]
MAKTMSLQATEGASCSFSVTRNPPEQNHISSLNSRHRRPRSSHSLTAPSSTLLSLLATIAASTTLVGGSPTPPKFLCPFISDEDAAEQGIDCDPAPSGAIHLSPTPILLDQNRRHVPDRYETDDQGHWRRLDTYTLYGSTICSSCKSPTTNSMSPVDDQLQVSPAASAPSASPTPTSTYEFLDTLPTGWKPTEKNYQGRTELILALSLVLAFLICFFIIGCLFWRKSLRRKSRGNDLEMKLRRQRSPSVDDRESIVEREARVKQKIWARATARGKRTAVPKSPQTTSLTWEDTQSVTIMVTPPSPTPSHRQSLQQPPLPPLALSHEIASNPIEISAPNESSYSPPAYRHRRRVPDSNSLEPPPIDHDEVVGDGFGSHTQRPCPHDSPPTSKQLDEPEYLHAAHVATDDKATLARLADLASAPPAATPPLGESSTQKSRRPYGTTMTFPSQSSLQIPHHPFKMASSDFYDYPYFFEEVSSFGPEPEPSAPPFEEGDSNPLDAPSLLPSAPPLSDAFGDLGLLPSAPECCSRPPSVREGDLAPLPETPSTALTPPALLVHGPIASDGTLPCYRP